MIRGRKQGRSYVRMARVLHQCVGDWCERTGDTEAEVAEFVGLGHKSHLNNMTNAHAPVAVDVLVRFVRYTGDRRPLEELLRLCEPEPLESSPGCVMKALMASTREALEFHQSCLTAAEDGEVTAAECDELERELNEFITASKNLVRKCRSLHGGRRERSEI